MEIYVDDEAKLTLHGLTQKYVKLEEDQKNRKLFDLLDEIEFNQVRARVGGCDPFVVVAVVVGFVGGVTTCCCCLLWVSWRRCGGGGVRHMGGRIEWVWF